MDVQLVIDGASWSMGLLVCGNDVIGLRLGRETWKKALTQLAIWMLNLFHM